MHEKKRIGFWMPETKIKKWNLLEFKEICSSYGYELFHLDLDTDLENQGNINALVYKLTDFLLEDDEKSASILNMVEKYLSKHPQVIALDPLLNVRKLLYRHDIYSIIESTDLYKYGVFTPNFCEINNTNFNKIEEQLQLHNISYPFVCKNALAQGPKEVHDMFIVFNKNDLDLCRPPCVVQSFVNHNATLYKIHIVGKEYCCTGRPSLKNFYPGNRKPIFFNTDEVSNINAKGELLVLDEEDEVIPQIVPNPFIIENIVCVIGKAFGVDLLGIDIIIENYTGRHAIIDVNTFPRYEQYPNFFGAVLRCINDKQVEQKYRDDGYKIMKIV
ncbi:hypothetical protein FQR65_LT02911 [Abscondita terminalis]|nr:hypothetical protein FQR65_LT02911 [Abscondita terminalis]